MGCDIKIRARIIIPVISLILSSAKATTVSSYPKDFRRSISPNIEWEKGLREAAHQALLREKVKTPGLHDQLSHAPIIGRENRATPFGDIAIIARGQLLTNGNAGYEFVQDSSQTECSECRFLPHCPHNCDQLKYYGTERLLALWTVKRIRHRGKDFEPRYELEYTISPTKTNQGRLITKRGGFDYNAPGHVFIVKTGGFRIPNQDTFISSSFPPKGYGKPIPPPPLSDFYPIQASTISSVHRRPARPTSYIPPDRLTYPANVNHHYLPQHHKPVPHYNYLPVRPTPTPTTRIPDYTLPHKQQIDIYKQLIDALAKKTSTTKFIPIPTQGHRFKPPTSTKTDSTSYHTSFIPITIPQTPSTIQQIPKPQAPTSFVPIIPTYIVHATHPITTTTKSQYPTTPRQTTTTKLQTPTTTTTKSQPTTYITHSRIPITQTTQAEIQKVPYTTSHTEFVIHTTPTVKSTSTTKQNKPTFLIPTTIKWVPTFDQNKITYVPQLISTEKTTSYFSTKPVPTFFIDPTHPGYPKTTPNTPFTETEIKIEHPPMVPTSTMKPESTQGTTLNLHTSDRYFPESTAHTIMLPPKTPPPSTPFTKTTRRRPKPPVIIDEDDDLDIFPVDKTKTTTTTSPAPKTSPKPTEKFLLHEKEYYPKIQTQEEVKKAIENFDKDFTTEKKATTIKTSSKPKVPREFDDLFQEFQGMKVTNKEYDDSNDLFGGEASTKATPTSKIIYSDFFIASTTSIPVSKLDAFTDTMFTMIKADTTRTMDTTRPTTQSTISKSYSTSVSYEINKNRKRKVKYKPNLNESRGKIKFGSNASKHIPTTDVPLKERVDSISTLEDLAYSVVNHARSIDYLENARRNTLRRKSYVRTRKIKKKST